MSAELTPAQWRPFKGHEELTRSLYGTAGDARLAPERRPILIPGTSARAGMFAVLSLLVAVSTVDLAAAGSDIACQS